MTTDEDKACTCHTNTHGRKRHIRVDDGSNVARTDTESFTSKKTNGAPAIVDNSA